MTFSLLKCLKCHSPLVEIGELRYYCKSCRTVFIISPTGELVAL